LTRPRLSFTAYEGLLCLKGADIFFCFGFFNSKQQHQL
jgi:hypothetical protein